MIEIKKIKKKWWIAAVILILVIWKVYEIHTSLRVSNRDGGEAEVSVVQVDEQSVTIEKKYIGFVKPINDVVLRPYINGFISQVLVEGGQNVKSGDVLVLIDQAEFQAALEAAEAMVAKAEADYAYAKDYYERIEKAGIKAMSQTEINNARAQYLSAEASLKQAKAAAKQAQVNLEYTVITAPIDGVVGSVPLTVGDYVSPQSELMSIVQVDPMRVVFSISDKDYLEEIKLPKMFEGEKVRIKLADGNIYEKFGKFRYIDNKFDRSTDSIAVYFDFENPQRELIDNAYVTALVEKKYKGIIWPKDLVNLQSDGSFVYASEGNLVKRHKVNIVGEYDNNYVLQNNFAPQERLVTDKIVLRGNEQKMKIIEKVPTVKERP